jgi:hypothetical protein
MDRRETIRTLLIGGMLGSSGLPLACDINTTEQADLPQPEAPGYGRTPEEKERDAELLAKESVFNLDELATIAVLCDIILPANETAGSAVEAGVPDFIDFIVKDIPGHEVPLKGGIMWLNSESNRRFGLIFKDLTPEQQLAIVEDIAWPEKEGLDPAFLPGVAFFNHMRNLTLTGYYTSEMGIKDLGYQGNRPNVWDGVPEEVLQDHDVDYDPEWIAKCVDQEKRFEIAQWDDEGNLLT